MTRPLYTSSPTAGFTIVELLVASAIGLVLMGFVATVFASFGQAVGQSQDTRRMHDDMRATAWVLRRDLAGLTCRVFPWQKPEADAGYFELLEGPYSDTNGPDPDDSTLTKNLLAEPSYLVADVDDVLMFTTQLRGGRFTSELNDKQIESPYAEVAWYCTLSGTAIDGQPLYELRRRQLLVRSYVGTTDTLSNANAGDHLTENATHVSKRAVNPNDPDTTYLPNGLSDLTKRENRFLHLRDQNNDGTIDSADFPFELSLSRLRTDGRLQSNEDIVLRNVIAFDVRVFDPQANPPRFIDLGAEDTSGTTTLEGQRQPVTAGKSLTVPTYCTWSLHYEFNGIDEDSADGIDQGTNRDDDNGDGEFETSPPYIVPLLGIQVTTRCIEPNSKQIRQITIRHNFRR
jgi:type II secretory pathway pseudopilin PulG